MKTHVLGFPRIGAFRELKKAVEFHWQGRISSEELLQIGKELRQKHWQIQKDAGLSCVATEDFSFYDHVLDATVMLGLVPPRFLTANDADATGLDLYFRMARGDQRNNVPAMEMTKWFDTNYHYIVPEITPELQIRKHSEKIVGETREAITAGFTPKPVLLGPITYLSLARDSGDGSRWERLDEIVAVYCEVIAELAGLCDVIQIDEPVLCTDMLPEAATVFVSTYEKLNQAAGKCSLMLASYFGALDDNLGIALDSGCAGLHIDLVRGKDQLDEVLAKLPETMFLSLGIVDGRNIWKTDLAKAAKLCDAAESKLGSGRVCFASSCSLLHAPVDLENETKLDAELKSWMAFAVQKCREVAVLGTDNDSSEKAEFLRQNAAAVQSRKSSPRVTDADVQVRCNAVTTDMLRRLSPYKRRKEAQSWLKLPLFPTTTIGSFPQTTEIRNQRQKHRKGEISNEQYEAFLKNEIKSNVAKQEELGLDVLVHGEPERNDMVEYFGQQLEGFCFSDNGWVQSYGSRCVKPPIIFGDVSRKCPMTVSWITYAQSLTDKPMKGMLTGPVTILCWSFVCDDLSRADVCKQIALAMRDEVCDLEKAGISIIQIDEAALREGMPLRKYEAEHYLRWAVDAFRLTSSGVADRVQIHSHMCYSQFNTIIESIAEMDADVISIESSRSRMQLLEAFRDFQYPNEIGPGVYDIHSPRVPSVAEIKSLLTKALDFVPKERLWVNPDCGLKTRAWPETTESLKNMVKAAHELRSN